MVKKVLLILVVLIALIVFGVSVDLLQDSSPVIVREGDLNNNGIMEEYRLEDFRLTVYEEGKIIWESPKEYKVDQLAIGDVTGDGKDNLAICVWKKGSFGKYRPFWHEGRDDDYKHHLFIYEYRSGTYKPKWFSSNLSRPMVHMDIVYTDDGYKLLVVEGGYKKGPFGKHLIDQKAPAETKLWEWRQWGFSLLALPGELDQKYSK